MRYKVFTWKIPTNFGEKKPQGLRPTNLNPLLKKNYTDLPDHFTLKTYSLTHTT